MPEPMEIYLGIDVGSVTTKFAVLSSNKELLYSLYVKTEGKPVAKVQEGLRKIQENLTTPFEVRGIGTTGSARYLAGVLTGADVVKNEITTHAVGTLTYFPTTQTILEIGGQDSKIILLRNGVITDFGMNTVCAAGTGSFLEHQAQRLNIKIEDFGEISLKSKRPVRIAGRCTVFAESDMVHKQQMGHTTEDILGGLCEALVRNYLNNIALGKEILPPVAFQGGVAFNKGIVKAFEIALANKIIVPPHHEVMGAVGAALLAQEEIADSPGRKTGFKGFSMAGVSYETSSFECKACPNLCEIAQVSEQKQVLARWGGRCDLWERNS